MVKRTLKKSVLHNLVEVKDGKVIARCGVTEKKPRVGLGSMVAFGSNCSDCDARTAAIKAGAT